MLLVLSDPPSLEAVEIKGEVTDLAAQLLKHGCDLVFLFEFTIEKHEPPSASTGELAADGAGPPGGFVNLVNARVRDARRHFLLELPGLVEELPELTQLALQ